MKKGFTLAEVLITLGIIGIVSAMTIPNLISKHNKRTIENYKSYCASNNARPAKSIYPSYFCTALIFKNNFKIPDDYPVKL